MQDLDLRGKENDNDKDDIASNQNYDYNINNKNGSVIGGLKNRPRLFVSKNYDNHDTTNYESQKSQENSWNWGNLMPKNTIQEQLNQNALSGIHQDNNENATTSTNKQNQNTTGEWNNYQDGTNKYLGDPHGPERRVISKGMERGIIKGAKGFLKRGYVGAVSGFGDGLVDGMTTEYLTQKFSQ